MRLTVVGCSDAFGSGGRFQTCFMVESGDRKILLDCGASSVVALKVLDVDRPNVIDLMKQGEIALVIETPGDGRARKDSYLIRRAAVTPRRSYIGAIARPTTTIAWA